MNARWGWLCLALAGLVLAGCGSGNSSTVTLTISPTSATVLLGTSLQFIPSETGSSNAITWSVNGVANGNATVGTISAAGLYTAPGTRPIAASPVAIPIIFAAANASVPNSGSTGSVIELQSGFDFTNYAVGNTINISNNSVAGWDGSFVIVASGVLQNGNFGVQIATPAGPPANGTGGTATATPNITITAQVQSTSATASATVTLDSGIRVSINQPSCSIGTSETFPFTATVTGAPPPPPGTPSVTWSLSGVGSIDPTSGLYTAPSTTGTATITATSLADPTETATATITVVTAADPTFTSLSPTTGALGAAFQNVYLTGTNFLCTTGILVNGTLVPTNFVSDLSSTTLLVQLPDYVLSTRPTSGTTTVLTFKVERQGGAQQQCSSSCTLTLAAVRPALVAATPDSVSSITSPPLILDGGYFGTTNTTPSFAGSPVVNVLFNGTQVPSFSFNSDRQLQFTVPGSSLTSPGLYPIAVTNNVTCATFGGPGCGTGSPNGGIAAINLAVQPTATPTQIGTMPTPVGTAPSSVAIDTSTGFAVVANQGSNDVTVLSVGTPASPSLSVTTASLCTGSLSNLPPCPVSGPASVAIDNIHHFALVANNASATLAVVKLPATPVATPPVVTALLSFPSADSSGILLPLAPIAVGINPVTGRALVAFTTPGPNGSNVGAILDMNQLENTTAGSVAWPPAVIGSVNINNGPKTPHIAVSTRLNWALATPGGSGSLSIVDLGRQTTNTITSISRNSAGANIVAVDTSVPPALQVGQPVLISGVSGFNGIFSVTAVSNVGFQYEQVGPNASLGPGGTANYSNPVATLATNLNVGGVSINDETQKALLVDPTAGVPAFVFNILDQTSALVNSLPFSSNNVASAMNPLTNVGVVVNQMSNQAFLVDPVTPTVIGSSFATGTNPVDVAIDPAADTALIVNQGSNNVSLFNLGVLRSAPAIIQSSFLAAGSTQASSHVTITSSLGSKATAQNQTVTLIGNFPSGSVPRLDGDSSPFTSFSIPNPRLMTATLSGTTLATNGPRQYLLDAAASTTPSNAVGLQAIQAVSLVRDCASPAPQGVAIDALHSVALATEPGTSSQPCNNVAMVSLSAGNGFAVGTGYGASPELAVGTNSQANPQGVAVYPQAGLAVVANAGNDNVSIVDFVNQPAPTTFTVDPIPSGVSVDLGTGKAVVTSNGGSVVDVFPVSTTAQTPSPIGVQRGPLGLAIDQVNHVAVVANSTSNNASILNLSSSTVTNTSGSINFPQGVAFDPVTDNFLITASASNQVVALNPNSVASTAIRVGIDPSSIAYNFESGTLVTANNLSGTMTVVDFIDQTVRGVFSLPSSTQFAIDIHPQTNLAVVADPGDNQLLLVPLPH